MTKMLLRRVDKLGKAGITIISDMGLFFHPNKFEEDLIKCETELLSSINDIKVKVLCCYNRSDFDMLIEHRMQKIYSRHMIIRSLIFLYRYCPVGLNQKSSNSQK